MQFIPRIVAVATVAAVLTGCGDIEARTAQPTDPTSPPTTAAVTTTTVDQEALTAWFIASAEAQQAEQQRAQQRQRTAHRSNGGGSWGPTTPSGLIAAQRPCAIPDYICRRESNMTVNAKNPSSSASGKYQFLDSTWNNFGGYAHAKDAPEAVQDERAAQLWNGGAGCSHWSAC